MIDFSIPLSGLQKADANLQKSAQRLAHIGDAGGDTVDVSAEMVALMLARNSAQANVKAAQAADEVARSTIQLPG